MWTNCSTDGKRQDKARILYLSWWNPWPPNDGARIRVFALLKALAVYCGYAVDLLSFTEHSRDIAPATGRFAELGIRARFIPWRIHDRTRLEQLAPRLGALVRGKPYVAHVSDCPAMRKAVASSMNAEKYRMVIADTSWMAQFVPVRTAGIRKLMHWHNVDFDAYGRRADSETNLLLKPLRYYNYWAICRFELIVVRRFDAVITVSEADRQLLLRNIPDAPQIHCLPLTVETEYNQFKPLDTSCPPQILFAGTMSYQPNIDAVLYFYKAIYPAIRRSVPNVRFVVAGKNPGRQILEIGIQDSSVTVTGAVADIREYYYSSHVAVAPIRFGGGMKTKILESMALGTPVVATQFAMEGISTDDGRHALIRDTPQEFAAAVVSLLLAPEIGQRLSLEARRLVDENFSQDALAAKLRKIVSACV